MLALQQLSGPLADGVLSPFSNRMSMLAAEIYSLASSGNDNSKAPADNSPNDIFEAAYDVGMCYASSNIQFVFLYFSF